MYGGTYQQVSLTIINTLGNIGGNRLRWSEAVLCRKDSNFCRCCHLWPFSSASKTKASFPGEGIIKDDIEETIKSMGYIGRVGMRATDTEILNVMIDRADINEEC